MAGHKPMLGKGNYIEYADDAVKADSKGNNANFLSYADAPTAKNGYVPKTELEKNNYGVYRDTPYEPETTIPTYEIEVSLVDPVNSSAFRSAIIMLVAEKEEEEHQRLGQINSPVGSTTVKVPITAYGICLYLDGLSVTVELSNFSRIGGVGNPEFSGDGGYLMEVSGNGAVAISNIDWND